MKVEVERRDGGWFAAVFQGDATIHFSRLDDETEWYADALWLGSPMPQFAHGFGSRCCRKSVAETWLREELDKQAAS